MLRVSMTELEGGKIEIDGVNIRDIGLDVVRGKLALGLHLFLFLFPPTFNVFVKSASRIYSFSRYPPRKPVSLTSCLLSVS